MGRMILEQRFLTLVTGCVFAACCCSANIARAETFINILTGGTSGVYYPLGVALSKVYSEKISGLRVQVQSTKASVENLILLQKGRGELAFALGDSVKLAWEGDAEAGYRYKLDKLRAVAAIYPNYIQIVAAQNSGIEKIGGLKGKRVSVGAPKSGTELGARAIFSLAGITYKDFGKTEYLPFSESVELMKNRQLDATLQSAGLGVASIRDLAASINISLVPVPSSFAEQLGPPYVAAEIPANTYNGQSQPVATLAVRNLLVTHVDVADDIVYQMSKQLFENLPTLAAAHKSAEAIKPEDGAKNLPIPLHPGAERFYKEMGLL